MSNIIKNPEKGIIILPDNAQWMNRFEIKCETSNRIYIVAQRKSTGQWGCSCPEWIFHRKCKHLSTLEPMLKQLESFSNEKEKKGKKKFLG